MQRSMEAKMICGVCRFLVEDPETGVPMCGNERSAFYEDLYEPGEDQKCERWEGEDDE